MINFGNKIKELRLQFGLTQKQLAKRIGVTPSVISYYEHKERYPSPDVIIRLSYIFHTSTDYLLGKEDKKILDISNLDKKETQYLYQMIDMFEKH